MADNKNIQDQALNFEKRAEKYNASQIQVLGGLEAVRKRPGMYIGNTSIQGLHHLVWEIIDNSIDEKLAGFATKIEITVNEDGSVTVEDDGRGIPVDIQKKTGRSALETVFTVLHAGGKFGGGGYKVSGGLHGVGASVVNALSTKLNVIVMRDGKKYCIDFNHGRVEQEVHEVGEVPLTQHGTIVRFYPDPDIFTETTVFDDRILKNRIRELAFLNKGLKLTFTDKEKIQQKKIFIILKVV
ncbi:ATPase/histidine kinase/DNA gyrase B/HSP90 domain protein [Lactobacillus iners SPIN 2503V10-D]|nr:ATPase/histidine kinase/DNA gyrase B/HSP90 domain protein [Lactobacillus iners SPIN 2503V10-D]